MTTSMSNSHQPQSSSQNFWLLPELMRCVREGMEQRDFAKLCLVSRKIYRCANPLLYERILLESFHMQYEDKKTSKKFRALHKSLTGTSGLSRHVKHLQFRFNQVEDYELATLPDIIRQCSNLRALYLADWSPFPDLGVVVTIIKSLPSLLHFGFDLLCQHGGQESMNESVLLQTLKHPSIKDVRISLQEGPERSPLNISMLPTSNTITRLVLDSYLGIGTLRKIITAVPRLRHLDLSLLRYADSSTEHVGSRLDFEALGNALAICSPTLESLKLAIQFDSHGRIYVYPEGGGKACTWGPFGSFPSLKAWGNLKSLELTPEALLGWQGETSLTLYDVLPTSLEYLYFRWDFGLWAGIPGRMSTVCKEIEKYLRASRGSRLKALTLTCFDFEVKYMELELTSTKSLCQQLGVAFSLETEEEHIRDRQTWAWILSIEYGGVTIESDTESDTESDDQRLM